MSEMFELMYSCLNLNWFLFFDSRLLFYDFYLYHVNSFMEYYIYED